MNKGGQIRVILAKNGIFIAMVVVALIFGAINHRFLAPNNLMTILQQIAELGIMAFPVGFVVMMGCADMSVGSVASLASIFAGMTMTHTGNVVIGVFVGLLFGLTAGIINGFLVAYCNLNTFVVTLGFLSVWSGLALFITDGKTIIGLPRSFTLFGTTRLFELPIQIWFLALVILLAWYILNRTAKGQEILAVGGNSKASFLMGINVRMTKMQVLAASGLFSAMSGIMLTAKLGAATPTVGSGMELTTLTVVLLGGVAFEGGIGRISGILAGLLFMGVLQNGLVILGVSAYLKTVFTGAVLVVAVMMDSSIQRIIQSALKPSIRAAVPASSDAEPGTSDASNVSGPQESSSVPGKSSASPIPLSTAAKIAD